jgi:hypothetical protein
MLIHQFVVRYLEETPSLTPKERAKGLAIALMHIAKQNGWGGVEIAIAWNHSQMTAKFHGNEIPDLDSKFVLDVNANPTAYADYR